MISGETGMTEPEDATRRLLRDGAEVVNIGLAEFAQALEGCGVPVVQLDWSPPAAGDARLIALLDRLGS